MISERSFWWYWNDIWLQWGRVTIQNAAVFALTLRNDLITAYNDSNLQVLIRWNRKVIIVWSALKINNLFTIRYSTKTNLDNTWFIFYWSSEKIFCMSDAWSLLFSYKRVILVKFKESRLNALLINHRHQQYGPHHMIHIKWKVSGYFDVGDRYLGTRSFRRNVFVTQP